IKNQGTVLEVSGRLKLEPAALADAAILMRRAAERATTQNNLHQIAIAMFNYESAMRCFPPPAISSKDGKPLLSWRVALLPYLDQLDLYNQFKLDEPWDSPNNKKLLEKMPKVYAPVRGQTKVPYSTYYQVFTGQEAPFRLDGKAEGPRIANFTDGTSNTFLVVEAGEAVPWTRPDDLPYDAKKPVPRLGGQFQQGFHAAMADGSILFIKKEIDEAILRALINPADAIEINWDKVPTLGNR